MLKFGKDRHRWLQWLYQARQRHGRVILNYLGVSYPRLNEIIHGRRSVTPDTALRPARVLGMPADFWLGLQQDWDLWHAMNGPGAAEINRLEPLVCEA